MLIVSKPINWALLRRAGGIPGYIAGLSDMAQTKDEQLKALGQIQEFA